MQTDITLRDNDVTRSAKLNAMLAEIKGSALTKSERVVFRADNGRLVDQKINALISPLIGRRVRLAFDNPVAFADELNTAMTDAYANLAPGDPVYLLIAGDRVLIAGDPVRMI